jgi:membrane protein required for colicin V production
MNWLDILLIAILAGSTLLSFRKGFSREVIGLVSVIAALLVGIWFYGLAGSLLTPYLSSRGLANFAGFLLVFGGVMLAGAAVSAITGRFLKVTGLSIPDRLLGAAFGLARGLIVAIALVMGAMAFSVGDRPPAAVVNSRVAPYVVDTARVVTALAPLELKEGFRRTYAQVKNVWERAVDDGIRKLPREKTNNERKI